MQKLIERIHQFQSESFVTLQGLFERWAKGQHPETLFITCSDSRIDPTLLTKAQPGDLFILRNAGNIVPPHGAEQNLLGVLKVKQLMPHDAGFELARPGKARRPIINNFSPGVR